MQQIHANEKDYELASSLLGVGVDYAHISAANYTRMLFLLSRAMLLLIEKKIMEVHPLLNQAGHLIENWQGSNHQKELLKVFFLVLQVSQFNYFLYFNFCFDYNNYLVIIFYYRFTII